MRGFILGLSLSIAFIAGALFSSSPVPSAHASNHKQYSECFAATTWIVTGRSLNDGKVSSKLVKVPTGFTPIGGGGAPGPGPASQPVPFIVFCR